jgi:DNA-directed RNA polymerase subunit RPC12/RpoP
MSERQYDTTKLRHVGFLNTHSIAANKRMYMWGCPRCSSDVDLSEKQPDDYPERLVCPYCKAEWALVQIGRVPPGMPGGTRAIYEPATPPPPSKRLSIIMDQE